MGDRPLLFGCVPIAFADFSRHARGQQIALRIPVAVATTQDQWRRQKIAKDQIQVAQDRREGTRVCPNVGVSGRFPPPPQKSKEQQITRGSSFRETPTKMLKRQWLQQGCEGVSEGYHGCGNTLVFGQHFGDTTGTSFKVTR